MNTPSCHCCDDSGIVTAITGEDRPCSRCRTNEFHAWACQRVRDEKEARGQQQREARA